MPLSRKYVLPAFFALLLIGTLVLGPLLYWGAAFIWPIPFHRAMDRALLISAIIALVSFRSRIPLGILWPLNGNAWKQLLLGYFIAAVSIQAMMGFNLALSGFTSAQLTGNALMSRILLAVVAALLIPPLEETLFRGFIQVELIERLGQRLGLALAATVYMLAHFMKIPATLDHQSLHPWSSLTALGAAFLPVVQGAFLCGRGLNLFLIGLILGGIFLRAGSLWVNAGLHSGWILALLLFSGSTRPVSPPFISFFGGDILSSFSTTLVLVLLALWLWRFYRRPSGSPETGENAP